MENRRKEAGLERKKPWNDYFGLNMSDGDRFGEIIPSYFAWMPPDEQRERVHYLETISRRMSADNKEGGVGQHGEEEEQ